MTTELYKHFSHFNFAAEQWLDAAKRYLELEKKWNELEGQDGEVDHDALADNFERCEVCEEISELQDTRDEFAREFAVIWAKQVAERDETQP